MAFVKGQSGNPGGRPKEDGEVKALARQFGPEAVLRLAELMRGDNPKVAVSAANALLDRGYGKPTQTNEVTAVVEATLNQGLGPVYGLQPPAEA
jgi:hypothetical protein